MENLGCSHMMGIDKDFVDLHDSHSPEDDIYHNSYASNNIGKAMSDDAPDDLMTLDQFQDKVCRGALIWKGSHVVDSFHKKGRVEFRGDGAWPPLFSLRVVLTYVL